MWFDANARSVNRTAVGTQSMLKSPAAGGDGGAAKRELFG